MSIFEQIKGAICKVQPGVDGERITSSALLDDDLDIDSLGRVELALALEEAFGFYLPDEELEDITTVGDIVSLIDSKLKTQDA